MTVVTWLFILAGGVLICLCIFAYGAAALVRNITGDDD